VSDSLKYKSLPTTNLVGWRIKYARLVNQTNPEIYSGVMNMRSEPLILSRAQP